MKEAYWFRHDSNARNDWKILALRSVYGLEGYGRFWYLIEMMRESEDNTLPLNKKAFYYSIISDWKCTTDEAKKFIEDCINDFELFECDEYFFWSKSLNDRLQAYTDHKIKRQEDGRKGGRPPKKRTELTQDEAKQFEAVDDKILKQKPVKTENATVAQYSDEVISLSDLLAAEMLKNNPQAKVPSNKDKWHNDMKLLLADGYEVKQIEQMILWCQSDDFWKSNILSARKLRDKAGTLIVQMGRKDDAKHWSNIEGTSRASEEHPRINGSVSRERIEELKERARKREEEKLRMSEVSG